jgi:hypothetical protein
MRLMERLAKLDDKVVFRRGWEWRGIYDRPYPLWMYFGSLVGAVVGLIGGRMITNGSGLIRVAGVAFLLLIILGYAAAVRRWRGGHRLRTDL